MNFQMLVLKVLCKIMQILLTVSLDARTPVQIIELLLSLDFFFFF